MGSPVWLHLPSQDWTVLPCLWHLVRYSQTTLAIWHHGKLFCACFSLSRFFQCSNVVSSSAVGIMLECCKGHGCHLMYVTCTGQVCFFKKGSAVPIVAKPMAAIFKSNTVDTSGHSHNWSGFLVPTLCLFKQKWYVSSGLSASLKRHIPDKHLFNFDLRLTLTFINQGRPSQKLYMSIRYLCAKYLFRNLCENGSDNE